MIFQRIKGSAKSGTRLPGTNYTVKGFGKRRGETALIYRIPSNADPRRHYEKGVTETEYDRAYGQLFKTGEFSRKWFNENLSTCAGEGPCNFIAIGKTFVLLGIADSKRGKYALRMPVKATGAER